MRALAAAALPALFALLSLAWSSPATAQDDGSRREQDEQDRQAEQDERDERDEQDEQDEREGQGAAATPSDASDRPWAQHVSSDDQSRSLELFRRGNERFERNDYASAIELYKEALRAWDHPAVHGNLAIALIHRDQPLAAFEHLESALRWGDAPFDPRIHEQLLRNRKLLLGQLSKIAVSCRAPEADVSLNGNQLLQCPGDRQRYVKAGPHELVARRTGYLTFAKRFQALPGRTTSIKVELVPLDVAGGYERRMAEWKPWVVVGAGLGLSLAGVAFRLAADGNLDDYDAEIARSCPFGCRPDDIPEPVRDLEARGELQGQLAVSSWIVGGAAVAAGAWLVYWNRPRRIRVDSDGNRLTIVPMAGSDNAGVAFTGRF